MSISRFYKVVHPCQKGFTLIELLIVVAILGVLAGICVPNVTQMIHTSTVNAANTELENVKTASTAYYGENNCWPADSSELSGLLNVTPNALYSFDNSTGFIIDATGITWTGISWLEPTGPIYYQHGQWVK